MVSARAPRVEGRSDSPVRDRLRRGGVAPALVAAAIAGAAGAQPVRVIDLLTLGTPADELTRIYGSSLQDDGVTPAPGSKGVPVAGGRDIDGDGNPDSAVSAVMGGPLEREGAGEVTVVFGDGTLGGGVSTFELGPGVLKIAGADICEIAGVEIEIADVTGDGLGDLLIGRQNHSPPSLARPGAGALTILVGGGALRDHAATSARLDLGAIPGTITATTFVGAASYDRLGIWMRTGDVDGDLIDDIVVGADQVDKIVGMSLEENRGAVYVIRGGAHLAMTQTIDLAAFGTVTFDEELEGHVALLEPPAGSGAVAGPPAKPGYHLGATVQIGDLDGDGKGEVLAAAALNRSNATLGLGADCSAGGIAEGNGGPDYGEVFIAWDEHFPETAWASGYIIDLTVAGPSPNLTRLRGSPTDPRNGELGEEMLAGLDYDGDGARDLFLGDLTGKPGTLVADLDGRPVAGLGHVFFNAGALRNIDQNLPDLLAAPPAGLRHTVIFGPSSVAIGADTAVHGDYDGDGLADLAMCNPVDDPAGRSGAGTVHVIYGEVGGWPSVIDLASANLPSPEATRIVEIRGAHGDAFPDGADTLCYSAAGGDMDLDGVPDLLINEMKGNGLGPDGDDPDDDPDPVVDVGNLLLIGGAPLLERVLLDVDGDGVARVFTDGVLLLRFLDGVGLPDLVEGAVAPEAMRPDAMRSDAEILTYLERAGAAIDVDGNDQLGQDDDGALAARWLLEFRGASLVDGIAFGGGATRTAPAEIEAFLDRLMP